MVFNCLPYNGENHILDLKLRIADSYTDYYFVTEGLWTHTGVFKTLRFNYTVFEYYEKYVEKIIYLPIRNMPNMVENQDNGARWAN